MLEFSPMEADGNLQVVDLADELNVTTRVVLDACDSCGVAVEDGGSILSAADAARVRSLLTASGPSGAPGALFALLASDAGQAVAPAAPEPASWYGAAAPQPGLQPLPTSPPSALAAAEPLFTRRAAPIDIPVVPRGAPSVEVPEFETAHGKYRIASRPIFGCEPFALAALAVSPMTFLFMVLAAYVSVFFMAVAWLLTGGVWWLAEEAEYRLSKRALRGGVAVLTAKVLASLIALLSVGIAYLLVRRWTSCAPGPGYKPPSYCHGGGLAG